VSVVLGVLAAWVQDDIEHVVGYTIAADAGFAVLSLAALEPEVWEPARTWLLIFVVGRSAFAAWAVAVHGGFGSRRLPELAGWARRAPVLAGALVVIAVASAGWPGLSVWDTRQALARLALPEPLAVLVALAPLASLLIYGRILAIGLREPVGVVAAGRGDRPRWPAPLPRRPLVGQSGFERAFERASHAAGGTLDVLWVLPPAARLNRMPIASGAVLALAGLAFAVSAGGLGVPEAARAIPAITPSGPGPDLDGGVPAPSGPIDAAAAEPPGGSSEPGPGAFGGG
jgi:Proton-conducting membrane transporter